MINSVTRGIVMLGRRYYSLDVLICKLGECFLVMVLSIPMVFGLVQQKIYSIVDQFNNEIVDSLCVAQRNPLTGDERVVLFLKVSSAKRKKRT